MDQLTDRLATLHREPGPPDRGTVDADLTRGHHALRRRNRQLTAGGLALVVVAGGVTYAVTRPADRSAPIAGHRTHPGTPTPTPSPSPSSSPSGPPTPVALKLAPYAGKQQPGFTVEKVPEGWVLQGADKAVLAIARPDSTTPVYDFEHKIAITWNSKPDPVGRPIEVNGRAGHLQTHTDGTRTLLFPDGAGHIVEMDVWSDVGLSDQQLVALAEGVRLTKEAQSAS